MPLLPASLSLDLDNKWSYMRTHGDPTWRDLPSYLDLFVPRMLTFFGDRELSITVFVVGQDAALSEHSGLLRALADGGHEIGNHSFHHEPWLHLYSREQTESEIARAEEAIEAATGRRPIGFRGPGYSLSSSTIEVLAARSYRYDASSLPTFLGPLARAYYFRTARLDDAQATKRERLMGDFKEGFRPLRPYRLPAGDGRLTELPVTTMPLVRTPIHLSYVLYLATFSPALGRLYFRMALALCRWRRVEPSILLHPLDFLGSDDDGLEPLRFFPGMRKPRAWKLERVDEALRALAGRFRPMPLVDHLDDLERRGAVGP